jgi:hypothetical protein
LVAIVAAAVPSYVLSDAVNEPPTVAPFAVTFAVSPLGCETV